MSKRAPIDQLDRNLEDLPNNSSVLRNATEEEIKTRKIFTIKRQSQQKEQEEQKSKPVSGFVFKKAELAEPETAKDSGNKLIEEEKKEKKPLFDIKPPSTDQMFSGSITIDKNQVNTNLFFNNAKSTAKVDEKTESTAVNSQENGAKAEQHLKTNKEPIEKKEGSSKKEDQEEKQIKGTEAAKNEDNETKGDDKKDKHEEKKEEGAKEEVAPAQKGLFSGGGMFGQNQQSSLFSANPNPLTGANQPSLFNKNQGSLFGNVTSSIFGGQNSNNAGATEQKSSIFANVGTGFFQNVNKDEEDEAEEGDEEHKEEEEEETPENFVEALRQDPNSSCIFIKACKNFKVGDNEALGMGYISIEQPKDKDKVFLLIFRNKTKRILHNSLIIPKLSNSVYMKGKKTAMTVLTLGMKKDEETGVVPKYYVKVGFETEEDAAAFKAEVEKIFNM